LITFCRAPPDANIFTLQKATHQLFFSYIMPPDLTHPDNTFLSLIYFLCWLLAHLIISSSVRVVLYVYRKSMYFMRTVIKLQIEVPIQLLISSKINGRALSLSHQRGDHSTTKRFFRPGVVF
jgi:hypothetical protein